MGQHCVTMTPVGLQPLCCLGKTATSKALLWRTHLVLHDVQCSQYRNNQDLIELFGQVTGLGVAVFYRSLNHLWVSLWVAERKLHHLDKLG